MGILREKPLVVLLPESDPFEFSRVEELRAQAVIYVVIVVGYLIGHVDHHGFQAREGAHPGLGPAGKVIASGVLDDALPGLTGEVEALETGVALLDVVHDPEGLAVVLEAAVPGHELIEHGLARMAEGRVAQVMGEGHRLGEVLVQPERPGDGAGDLGHLEAVGQARPVVVALVVDEDLGLVLQAAEGRRVDDAVPVALKGSSQGMLGLRMLPPE